MLVTWKKFVLVLNAKKAELAKLKYQVEESTSENGHKSYTMDVDSLSNKRTRNEASHTDTSDDEPIEIDPPATQSKLKTTDSSLDLGNDQIDYKPSTVPKQHQGRKYPTGATTTISTRPIIHSTSRTTTMTTPSLHDDSQTADDLLNKI